MTISKRIFDIAFSILFGVLLFVPFCILAAILLGIEGGPLFYVSERMKNPHQSFRLIKLRTMSDASSNSGVTGGDKVHRISRMHAFLRRTRIDEVPQLWNILRGDMSFVGPRPPLRVYTDAFPELYAQVLQSRPGVTGLASMLYHKTEEQLLSQTKTPEETDAVYRRRCIPIKARLDLIYQKHSSVCFDFMILGKTISKVVSRSST